MSQQCKEAREEGSSQREWHLSRPQVGRDGTTVPWLQARKEGVPRGEAGQWGLALGALC